MSLIYPPHISTAYVSTAASAPTPLWSGRLHQVAMGGRATGRGAIKLAWRPEPWIGWDHETDQLIPAVLNADRGRLVPWGLGTAGGYERTEFDFGSSRSPRVRSAGFLPGGLETGRRRRLESLVFHLVNFPDYVGEPVTLGGATWLGRTSFEAQGWITDLDWVRDYRRLRQELRADRGYALTHVGRLSRADGVSFSPARGLTYIEALHHFFGFVRGGWAGPALLSGRDASDTAIWEQWSVKRVSPANYRHSFFVDSDPDMLARLAPGFMAKLNGRAWGEPYSRAVKLYVDANVSVPIEIGILLAQAGLELLSWSSFVRSGRVTPKDFDLWPAARQFRELLTRAKIPMAVPARLSFLAGTLPGLAAGSDAAERIVYVRNRIVHPPRNKTFRSLPSALLIDAWRLSLQYLELSLLYLARYRGSVWSRVEESVVPVPW